MSAVHHSAVQLALRIDDLYPCPTTKVNQRFCSHSLTLKKTMNSDLGLFCSSGLMELYSTRTGATMQHMATFKVHIFSYLFDSFDSPMDERTRNNLCTLSPRSVTVHCIFSGLFGSAVGKRTGNNLYVC